MRRSRQFDDTIIEQIRSGEESGHIGDSLSRLVQQLTRELEFKSKIKSAMMYPVMICIVMIAVLWVMMTLVVPSLAGTLLSMGGELPLITRIVIGISNIMSAATPYTVILVVLSVMAYRMAVRIPDVRLTVDGCKLKLPIIGTMLEKIELARAARNLSALLESGIPLCSALGITQKAAKNRQTAVWFLNACRFVEMSGMNLAAALSKSGRFPAKFLQLVEVGINSGQICEILNRVAEQYEKEVDTALKRVTSLIEPLMIVFVGLIAGTVVISIFLPMFSISDML